MMLILRFKDGSPDSKPDDANSSAVSLHPIFWIRLALGNHRSRTGAGLVGPCHAWRRTDVVSTDYLRIPDISLPELFPSGIMWYGMSGVIPEWIHLGPSGEVA